MTSEKSLMTNLMILTMLMIVVAASSDVNQGQPQPPQPQPQQPVQQTYLQTATGQAPVPVEQLKFTNQQQNTNYQQLPPSFPAGTVEGSQRPQQFPPFNGPNNSPFSGIPLPPPPPMPFDATGIYSYQALPLNSLAVDPYQMAMNNIMYPMYPAPPTNSMYPTSPSANSNPYNNTSSSTNNPNIFNKTYPAYPNYNNSQFYPNANTNPVYPNQPARLDANQMKELTNSILNQMLPKQVKSEAAMSNTPYAYGSNSGGGYQYVSNPYDLKAQAYNPKTCICNDQTRQDIYRSQENNLCNVPDRAENKVYDPCPFQNEPANLINRPFERTDHIVDDPSNVSMNQKSPCENAVDPCAHNYNQNNSSGTSFFQSLFGGGGTTTQSENSQSQPRTQQQAQSRSIRRTYPDYSLGLGL